MRRSRRRFTAMLLLATMAATIAAGCSGDGDDGTPSPAATTASPTATSASSPATEGFLSYHNEEEGFTIGYSEEWILREDELGTLVFIAEPPETDFAANVNVVVEDVPSSVDLYQYENASVEQVKSIVSNFHGLETTDTEIGGLPAIELTYLGSQGQFDLHWLQHLILVDGRAFVLTFTAEEDRFDEVEPTARSILESFRVD